MLFVLFEHSAGYALFEVTEFEEVGTFLPQVEQSVTDLARFNKVVKLTSFVSFSTAIDALEAINAISEGKTVVSSTILPVECWKCYVYRCTLNNIRGRYVTSH